MFRPIEPSSDQIQNTVPVHSVSTHIVGSDIVYRIVLTLKIVFYSVSGCIQSVYLYIKKYINI
jgi:hypothetical protein